MTHPPPLYSYFLGRTLLYLDLRCASREVIIKGCTVSPLQKRDPIDHIDWLLERKDVEVLAYVLYFFLYIILRYILYSSFTLCSANTTLVTHYML